MPTAAVLLIENWIFKNVILHLYFFYDYKKNNMQITIRGQLSYQFIHKRKTLSHFKIILYHKILLINLSSLQI